MNKKSSPKMPNLELAENAFGTLRKNSLTPPGVTRPPYSGAENMAHLLMKDISDDLKLDISVDYAGNQYMTLPGRNRDLPAVFIGSHMDTVPHGGNYDGAAGVIMGLSALEQLRRDNWQPSQDITVMAIRAEEALWFAAPYIGSRMAFGRLSKKDFDNLRRFDTGDNLGSYIEKLGFDIAALRSGKEWLSSDRIRCFVEPHIEQGPALVGANVPVGIVTGIRGNIRYRNCSVLGNYGHAGAVPRQHRSDALFAAVEFANVLENYWDKYEAAGVDFVCTMGEFFTDPDHHGMTKIAGEVRFTMDIRSLNFDTLISTDKALREEASRISSERNVNINLGEFHKAKPAIMDEELRQMLHQCADDLGIQVMPISSGAGHDCATFAHEGVPCAMIFIRNENGSHNPNESMEMPDFGEALRVLVYFIKSLDK